MFHYLLQCLVCFLIGYLEFATSDSFIGDFCIHGSRNESGICQLFENCRPAIQALHNGIHPQTCGFQSSKPIVCCVGGGDEKVATAKQSTTHSPVAVKIGAKAIQKCKEYGQLVNIVETAPGGKTSIRQDCGFEAISLVGGESAFPKEFPHMAIIGTLVNNKKEWYCGGSLISDQYILTAAHCLDYRPIGAAKYIRLGDVDILSNNDDTKPQEFNVKSMFKHPQYKPPSQYNDIALLQMDKKAILNNYVRPICLNTNPQLIIKHGIVSSWGKSDYKSETSNQLTKVTLNYVAPSECNSAFKNVTKRKFSHGIAPDTQLCAGSYTDICQGDSGSPLQIFNFGEVYCTYKLVGVTSLSKYCGLSNFPGVYTLVSPYIEWIENIVWP